MRARTLAGCTLLGAGLTLLAPAARADEARVSVGGPDERFAPPPPRGNAEDAPIAVDDRDCDRDPPYRSRELFRAPFRLSLGPAFASTGRGVGVGLGVAADFGTGTVGFRLSGAWTRKETSDAATPLGDGLGQYTGELTLDLHKRGPWHPVVGVGLGLAHVSRQSGDGNAGIGTARFGFDYAIFVEDADVRLGAGILGALAGPSDRELADLRGYVLFGGSLTIGF